MRKTFLAVLLTMPLFAFAGEPIVYTGVGYLEAGEEIYHRMDTRGYQEGEVVELVDKENPQVKAMAKIKKLMAKSVVLAIQ